MAIHIVIDGYNLTGVAMHHHTPMDLEGIREELIKRLQAYKRIKGHRITIVFDGKRSGSLSRGRINQGGIEIIFSRDGEEADLILKEMAKNFRERVTVVTSDRAVASFAEAHGAVAIPSDEFDAALSMSFYSNIRGNNEEGEENVSTKSGNPRRLSKQERRRIQKLKKL